MAFIVAGAFWLGIGIERAIPGGAMPWWAWAAGGGVLISIGIILGK